MTSSRWQKTNELNGIFGEFFVSQCFVWALFIPYKLLLLRQDFWFYVFMGLLCVQICVSLHECFLCFFSAFLSISLFYFILVCFYFLSCLFSHEKKKCGFGQMVKDLGGVGGQKNSNQNILYEKKSIFNLKNWA